MERGYAAAAAHVFGMPGFLVQRDCDEVPYLVMPEGSDDATDIHQLFLQYGPRLDGLFRCGIPIRELATEYAATQAE